MLGALQPHEAYTIVCRVVTVACTHRPCVAIARSISTLLSSVGPASISRAYHTSRPMQSRAAATQCNADTKTCTAAVQALRR